MHGLTHNSREMFNKWQAQRWWTENYEKVMELYNVQKFNSQAAPLPSIPRSENEVRGPLNHLSRCSDCLQHAFLCCPLLCHGLHFMQSSKDDNPATAPLNKGQLLDTLHRPLKGSGA
jgi:hypothetical protein